MPAGHVACVKAHDVRPAGLKEGAVQDVQKVAGRGGLARDTEKEPAGHSLQNLAPAALEKVPLVHVAQLRAPVRLLAVPAAQGLQKAAEVAEGELLTVPGAQGVQKFVPGALQEPRAQHTPAPTPLVVFAGQGKQLALEFPPTRPLKVLDGHWVHVEAPPVE